MEFNKTTSKLKTFQKEPTENFKSELKKSLSCPIVDDVSDDD